MTLRLVSDNPYPIGNWNNWERANRLPPEIINARHEAEWAQPDQTTADGWSLIYAIGFACFGAGCVVTTIIFTIERLL